MFVLTFIQRSAQHSLTALSDELTKLNPRVEFAQTYPDEIQGAFESSADALQAALYASREQGFWVGIGIDELRIPRFAGALGTVSTNDCTGDALEFSRLAVEAARTGAPARGIAVSAHNRAVADMASGLTRLLYRVCSDRTEAEWRVVDLLVPGVRGQQRAVRRRSALPPRRSAARSCARSGTKSRRHARRYSTCSTGWIHHRLRPYKSTSQMLTTGILREIFAF